MTPGPGLGLEPQCFDDWHQLVHAARGVMEVETETGVWVVPPHRAIWIPAGEWHSVRLSGRVALRTLFVDEQFAAEFADQHIDLYAPFGECRAINVPPLLRELVLHTCRLNVLHPDNPAHVRVAELILDQLHAVEAAPLQLPMPRDERARRAAEIMLEGSELAISAIASSAGASPRTLERLFVRDTAMTAGRWRQRARMIAAVRLLASGAPVGQVAGDVGYGSPSAFIAAFRALLGTTPSRYFEARPLDPEPIDG